MGKITIRFKQNPTFYYAMSIVASWAGVGSLMNFKTLALESGGWSAIIWAFANAAACAVFGIIIGYLPTMRKVMQTKAMFFFIGFLTLFQSWTQMSGIQQIFEDTPIGGTGGMILAYAIAITFAIILLKRGTLRNILVDSGSWILVYVLLLCVTIASLVYTKGAFNVIDMSVNEPVIKTGIFNGLLLMAGPFTYPYFYEIYDYNENNSDGTRVVNNIRTSFILAGVMFGVYMVFAAMLAWTNFSPTLNVVKAILITIVATSSLSTYLYSEYLVFGKKWGGLVNFVTIAGWYFLIPMGVMGIWQFMASIRWMFILGALVVAIIIKVRSRHEQVSDDKTRLS